MSNHDWNRFEEIPYDKPTPPTIHRGGLYQADGLRDGLIVPGLQAVITGVLCGIALGALSAWVGLPAFAIGGTAAFVIMAFSWVAYRGRWQYVLERLIGVDINMDGFIGTPQYVPQQQPMPALPLRVEVSERDGQTVTYSDLPYPDQLRELAPGLAAGTFNFTVGTGKRVGLDQNKVAEVRNEMLSRGLAVWKSPGNENLGVILTAKGRAVFRGLADQGTVKAWAEHEK